MLSDGWRLNAEQFGHAFLGKPDGFVFDDGVDAHIFFGRLVHQKTKIVAHGSALSFCLARALHGRGVFDDHFADARKMVDVPISLPELVQHGLFRIHGIPVRWLYG